MENDMQFLTTISEHVWILPRDDESHRPALGYIRDGDDCMLVDCGNSPDHVALAYGCIRAMDLPDPKFAALTHWHWDHVFGLSGSPAKSIANSITNEKLISMQRWDWSDSALSNRVSEGLEIPAYVDYIKREMPMRHSFKVRTVDITYVTRMALRLNHTMVEMYHVGGPHSEDSSVIFVPGDKVLFVGDCYLEDVYTGGGSLQIQAFSQLLKRINAFDADWIIPSHDAPMKKKEFMQKMRKIEKIGNALKGINNFPDAVAKLTAVLNHEPTEEELRKAGQFIAGNLYPNQPKQK